MSSELRLPNETEDLVLPTHRHAVRIALVAVAIWAIGLTGVAAGSETDNGTYPDAEGPMENGIAHAAVLSAEGDVDWFYFYVPSRGDVTISRFNAGDSGVDIMLSRYRSGHLQALVSLVDGDNSTSLQLEPGLYYVSAYQMWRVSSDSYPMDYSVTVSGAVASQAPSVGDTHRSATVLDELNESGKSDAHHVEAHENYAGSISSQGDVDWYMFDVASVGDVEIGYENVAGDGSAEIRLFGADAGSWEIRDKYQTIRLNRGTYYLRAQLEEYDGNSPPVDYVFSIQGDNLRPQIPINTPTAKRVVYKSNPGEHHVYDFRGAVWCFNPGENPLTASATRMRFYRFQGDKWVYKFSRSTTLTGTASDDPPWTYSSRVRLTDGKWRVRGYHECAEHGASFSPLYRTFTVGSVKTTALHSTAAFKKTFVVPRSDGNPDQPKLMGLGARWKSNGYDKWGQIDFADTTSGKFTLWAVWEVPADGMDRRRLGSGRAYVTPTSIVFTFKRDAGVSKTEFDHAIERITSGKKYRYRFKRFSEDEINGDLRLYKSDSAYEANKPYLKFSLGIWG